MTIQTTDLAFKKHVQEELGNEIMRQAVVMAQERIGIDAVESWLAQRLPAC